MCGSPHYNLLQVRTVAGVDIRSKRPLMGDLISGFLVARTASKLREPPNQIVLHRAFCFGGPYAGSKDSQGRNYPIHYAATGREYGVGRRNIGGGCNVGVFAGVSVRVCLKGQVPAFSPLGGRGGLGRGTGRTQGQEMKIIEYLQSKYDVQKPTTMTKVEAMAFGIPYPLRAGWLAKYGDKHIEFSDLEKLRGKLDRRLARQDRKKSRGAMHTQEGLVILDKLKNSLPNQVAPSSARVNSPAFLDSYEWRAMRIQALKKYGAKCQCCGATPATGAVMNVDHIKPRRIYPALALDINNLQVLCHECNHGKGNWDMTDWRTAHAK